MFGAAVMVLVVAADGMRQQEEELDAAGRHDDGGCRHDHDQHEHDDSAEPDVELQTTLRPLVDRRPPATASSCPTSRRASARPITGVGSNDFETRAKLLKEFADKTPSDIRPDFEVLADAFKKYASALKDIHFTPGKVPDAATLAKLQQLSTSIDQASVTKASTNIAAWAQKNCTAKG